MCEILRQLVHCGVPLESGGSDEALKLIVGVSGGPDSLALLLGCLGVAGHTGNSHRPLLPIAAHVHHHLRPSADDDAQLVGEVCERFGIEMHVEHVRPGELDGNISANARLMRYEALLKIARRAGAGYVAVAHHGDDQLETMLMALGRGAGIEGLSGMTWCRPLWHDVMLVRPLLGLTKDDCLEFCRKAGVAWREDPSNSDPQRVRARLRRDVIPVLRELWPDLGRRASATAEALEAAREALQQQIEVVFGPAAQRRWSRSELAAESIPLLGTGLRRAALDALPGAADSLNQKHLLLAAQAIRSADRRPHRYAWPGGLELKVTSREVLLLCDGGGLEQLMDALADPPARSQRRGDDEPNTGACDG